MPPALKQLQQVLSKGIKATATLWPPLRRSYEQVHQAAQILANHEQRTGAQVREHYLAHVAQMQERKADVGPLSEAIEHFCHITNNFAVGLFHCYDVEGLPRTNNDLEHCFGVARVHERRATGRRGAIPALPQKGIGGEIVQAHQAISFIKRAKRERGVVCGETPANQSCNRQTFIAVAITTC